LSDAREEEEEAAETDGEELDEAPLQWQSGEVASSAVHWHRRHHCASQPRHPVPCACVRERTLRKAEASGGSELSAADAWPADRPEVQAMGERETGVPQRS
jgi:hypothetical protein